MRYLGTLSDDDLDRVIDESWNPPVTLGVRLVSVVNDDMQHAGQADSSAASRCAVAAVAGRRCRACSAGPGRQKAADRLMVR